MSISSELWLVVFCFLDRKTLAGVAQTSVQFSNIARPILYRSLSLRSNKEAVQATFQLLRNDPSIAAKVEDLHLFTEWRPEEQKTWIDPTALSRMIHLKSITMTGSPFITAEEQNAFLATLRMFCSSLAKFTYHQGRYPSPPFLPNPHPTRFPSDDFSVNGIETLVWDDNDSFSQPQVRSLMRASLQTICYLSLPSPIDDFGVTSAISFYHEFRFPRLKSFAIGDWVDYQGEDGPRALVGFLAAHSTIEHLALDYEDTSEYTPELLEASVASDLLPNLQSLHCHAINVLTMLRAGVQALGNLTKLSVGHGLHPDAEEDIDQMLDGLLSHGGLPLLEDLHFDPGESCGEVVKVVEWVSQWSRICPRLKKWSGTLPDMKLGILVSVLSGFSVLSRIRLSYSSIPNGEQDIWTVASQIPHLKEVVVQPAGEYTIRRSTYHIERDGFGSVSRLIIRKYSLSGCHVGTSFYVK